MDFDRLIPVIRQLALDAGTRIMEVYNGPDFAVCVTHKGIIRAALSLALGWDMRDKPPFKLKWRAAHIFVWEDGRLRLETANLALPSRA